jgi:hypothetical protein
MKVTWIVRISSWRYLNLTKTRNVYFPAAHLIPPLKRNCIPGDSHRVYPHRVFCARGGSRLTRTLRTLSNERTSVAGASLRAALSGQGSRFGGFAASRRGGALAPSRVQPESRANRYRSAALMFHFATILRRSRHRLRPDACFEAARLEDFRAVLSRNPKRVGRPFRRSWSKGSRSDRSRPRRSKVRAHQPAGSGRLAPTASDRFARSRSHGKFEELTVPLGRLTCGPTKGRSERYGRGERDQRGRVKAAISI